MDQKVLASNLGTFPPSFPYLHQFSRFIYIYHWSMRYIYMYLFIYLVCVCGVYVCAHVLAGNVATCTI